LNWFSKNNQIKAQIILEKVSDLEIKINELEMTKNEEKEKV